MPSQDSDLARQSAVFVWADRALFVGDRSETSLHAHHATEISVALDARGVDVGAPGGSDLVAVPGAIVRAGAAHRLCIPGPKVAVLYLDPQTGVAASVHNWLGDGDIRPIPFRLMARVRARLRGLLEATEMGFADATKVCSDLVAHFGDEVAKPTMDHRVRRAVELINAAPGDPPDLEWLASELGTSASRLRHMFAEQVGVPMSRYVLWMRLRRALVEALNGASMTKAAQAAGFSDASHFTRTCRQMFGLPPTAFTPVDSVFVA